MSQQAFSGRGTAIFRGALLNGRLYYEEVLARLRPGGVLILDNVLWGGKVVAPHRHPEDASLQAICALNDVAAADARVEPAFLPLGDGLLLLQKR